MQKWLENNPLVAGSLGRIRSPREKIFCSRTLQQMWVVSALQGISDTEWFNLEETLMSIRY